MQTDERLPQTIPELYEALCVRFDAIETRLDRLEGEVRLLRRGIENLEEHLLPRKNRVVSTRGPRFPVVAKERT